MWHRFIVWWRGWDENDILSAQMKLDKGKLTPGGITELTDREMAALPEMFKRDKIKRQYEMMATMLQIN